MDDECCDKVSLLTCESGQLEAHSTKNLQSLTKPPGWKLEGLGQCEACRCHAMAGTLKILPSRPVC